jgi:cobyrinic acid a,c-diamide synthase
MLAAPNSGAGKTTVTLALLSAFKKRGISPVAFKCGPDYIDPMFHREVLGLPSYNLDLFFTGKGTLRGLFCHHAEGHGIAVIEGVMGYYDGIGMTEKGSSHDLAQAIETPVILIVSARGVSLSLAALIKGFADFRKPSMIAGVILNDCSEKLYQRLKDTLEGETGLRLLGYLPRLKECSVESRHLGLVTAAEIECLKQKIERLGEQAEKSIDLDALMEIAYSACQIDGLLLNITATVRSHPRIAVANDNAFCFYYADNLELLERQGAVLVPFSPLKDKSLPEGICGLYLGGGYPELYTEALSANSEMLETLRCSISNGLPTLAECGGFLYLHESLEDSNGFKHPMVGILPGHGFKTSRLQRFGYTTLTACTDNVLCRKGDSIPAHEFHYWDTTLQDVCCTAEKPDGRSWPCVTASGTLFAGFPHLYFYGNPDFARGFVEAAAKFSSDHTA